MSRLIRALITVGTTVVLVSVYLAVPDVRQNVDLAIGRVWSAAATGDITPLREYILSFGLWAPLVSTLLMILQSVAFPLPAFGITLANGAIFGPLWGAALSWSSAMIAAALCFVISRSVGRPPVEKLVGGNALRATDRFFERYGSRSILLARLIPIVSFDIVSYAAGLTPVTFWQFMIATGIGQLPATIVYSLLGNSLGQAATILWGIAGVALLLLVAWMAKILFERRVMREEAQA